MAYDEALAQRIRQVLRELDVAERRMFGGLAFLLRGRMCRGVQDADDGAGAEGPAPATAQGAARAPDGFTGRSLGRFVLHECRIDQLHPSAATVGPAGAAGGVSSDAQNEKPASRTLTDPVMSRQDALTAGAAVKASSMSSSHGSSCPGSISAGKVW